LNYTRLHDWPATREDAYAIQQEMAEKVTLFPEIVETPRLIAAVDTAYGYGGETIYASAVVTTFPEIEEVERFSRYGPAGFPYVPGLLFFREGPVIIETLAGLQTEPDIIIVHGHGTAHPKGCGMAGQIGILFDRPTVGCCRKLLTGSKHRPLPADKGSFQPVLLRGKEVGIAYRSKDKVKPIFVSPGYKCDMKQAREIVVQNLRGYRLPEPLRLAHLSANTFKRYIEKKQDRKNKIIINDDLL